METHWGPEFVTDPTAESELPVDDVKAETIDDDLDLAPAPAPEPDRATLTRALRELEAAIALAAARHTEFQALEDEVDRAQQALEDRKVVERAKGLLMSALDLTEQDAFRRLQLTARERNLRLADVAARIVEQQSLLAPKRKPPAPR